MGERNSFISTSSENQVLLAATGWQGVDDYSLVLPAEAGGLCFGMREHNGGHLDTTKEGSSTKGESPATPKGHQQPIRYFDVKAMGFCGMSFDSAL